MEVGHIVHGAYSTKQETPKERRVCQRHNFKADSVGASGTVQKIAIESVMEGVTIGLINTRTRWASKSFIKFGVPRVRAPVNDESCMGGESYMDEPAGAPV